MGMWEIDALLTNSIELIRDSELDSENKRHIVWNLENIPEEYEFDAGSFEKTELTNNFEYKKMNPYQLGKLVMEEAKNSSKNNLVYDWSAFLLNYWNEYFFDIDKLDNLKSKYLGEMKIIFEQFNFSDYKPIHASLTIYKHGNKWFSKEQNNLIKWYCT